MGGLGDGSTEQRRDRCMVGLIDAVIVDPKQLTKLIQKHNNQSDVTRLCIGDEDKDGAQASLVGGIIAQLAHI